MGTPEFAVPSLKILIENNFNLVGIVTAPDKPRGRGQKISFSPVKEFGKNLDIPVLQPVNLKSAEFINELGKLEANLQVIIAFRMLPQIVWEMPEYGSINLHASLLPQYRGAAPINWAIINGETKTGVSTFFLKHKIDTGNLILQKEEIILANDTAGTLYTRLMEKGAQLVLETCQLIKEEKEKPIEQIELDTIHKAPKIFKVDCEINWGLETNQILNFIRGLSPYPAAWTILSGSMYKIYEAISSEGPAEFSPGEHTNDQKTFLKVKCKNGWIEIKELQKEGKKRMNVIDFLKGNKI